MKANNLTQILLDFNKKSNKSEYLEIIEKIMNGDYTLILPSKNNQNHSNDWNTINKGDSLTLTSVFNADGVKILAAFSSIETMSAWSNEQLEYKGMKSDDVMEFCQNHNISKIVIDPNQPSTFVLERASEKKNEGTKVSIYPLTNPIEGELLNRFMSNFRTVDTINEAYQYLMVRNNESILVIGLHLSNYGDNSRNACLHAIQNTMKDVQLDSPLEMFFLENDNWYETVKSMPNSLMYKK